jgi:hypothetical protein
MVDIDERAVDIIHIVLLFKITMDYRGKICKFSGG